MVVASAAAAPSRLAPLGWLFKWLPALALAMLGLHAGELWASRAGSEVVLAALRNDAVAFLRHAWIPALVALPFLFLQSERARRFNVALAWSLLLAVQALLIEYHAGTGVPLGGDLFSYSIKEVGLTAAGAGVRRAGLLGLGVALALLWGTLALLARTRPPLPTRFGPIAGLVLMGLAAWLAPSQNMGDGRHLATLSLHKGAYFVENTLATLGGSAAEEVVIERAVLDPAHPFLRVEQTPDTLGPMFTSEAGKPPNVVIIVVEGLGRSFSGPGARLGSFTPFLDELGARSLYFENFLATQGRTFAVLPSILGSLPFAANGYAALGEDMPAHLALTSLLKNNGYALRFYTGSNLAFDNEGLYLRRAGVDTQISEADFAPGLRKSSEWGYADRELIDLVLEREAKASAPFLTIVQTSSMHMPFEFPGKQRYGAMLEGHLNKIGIPAARHAAYQDQRQVYASILYTDDALRHYFNQASRMPGYANTIFIITGDHRMPELAMESRLERYHVPLIIFSPLLKAPLSIKSVSSHFDIAPSIAAMLGARHGVKLPSQVTWLGTGLDLEPSFRNVHVLPIKQTKTELSDFISGTAYLGQDRLYTIADGMQITPLASAGAREQIRRQFGAFNAANSALARGGALLPEAALVAARPFDPARRSLVTLQAASQTGALYVQGVKVLSQDSGSLRVAARFSNRGRSATAPFVPLLVLTDEKGNELREAYGKARSLDAAQGTDVELQLDRLVLAPGTYYVSVIPSHPDNGKPVGTGQYHVAVKR